MDFLKCGGGQSTEYEVQTGASKPEPRNQMDENFEVGVSEKEMMIMTQSIHPRK